MIQGTQNDEFISGKFFCSLGDIPYFWPAFLSEEESEILTKRINENYEKDIS